MKCKVCNNEINDSSNFCVYCGSNTQEDIIMVDKIMKCKFCNNELKDSFNFCVYCGRKTREDILINRSNANQTDIIEKYSWNKTTDKNTGAKTALSVGILAIVLALIISGIYSISAIILGVIGVTYGVKNYRTVNTRRAMWGAILGGVASFVATTSLLIFFVNVNYANQTINKYSKEFGFELPNVVPYEFYRDSQIQPRFIEYYANEFYYQLNDNQAMEFQQQIDIDERWLFYPENANHFIDKFIDLNVDFEGYYLIYDRINFSFQGPSNFIGSYDFVIIIYDEVSKQIIIYEIWK